MYCKANKCEEYSVIFKARKCNVLYIINFTSKLITIWDMWVESILVDSNILLHKET